MASRIEEYNKSWRKELCKPESNDICEHCKHTGEDHRVAAIDNEYRSPCAKEIYPFGTTSFEPQFGAVDVIRLDDSCDCPDFVFSDKQKQELHLKLLRTKK